MSWDKYKKSRLLDIDLNGINLDGFWVKVRRIKSFTGAEADEVEEVRKQAESEDKSTADAAVAKFLGFLVMSWNITDPDDESKILALPKDDPKVIKKLPLEVFSFINEKIEEEEKKPLVPPK